MEKICVLLDFRKIPALEDGNLKNAYVGNFYS